MIINQKQDPTSVLEVLKCNFGGECSTSKSLQPTFAIGKGWRWLGFSAMFVEAQNRK